MIISSLPNRLHETVINEQIFHISGVGEQYDNTRKKRYHIFMITGNPGYIGYYHEFLLLLWHELNAKRGTADVSIYGTSMSGFVSGCGAVVGLRDQIAFLEQKLVQYIKQHTARSSNIQHEVIIVGHSVGAYIGLELIKRHQDRIKSIKDPFRILGYVGLWPTLTHIAQSKRGRRIGWLLKMSFFATCIGLIARLLAAILGLHLLVTILKLIGFPEKPAEVTANFLASPSGVRQALYMAGDEMREITSDRWSEDIWGARSHPGYKPTPRLVLCFGEDDHWVANHHRDDLIRVRGRRPEKEWFPEMIIDKTGIPHSFCIHHSEPVAEKTAAWITNMMDNMP